MELNLNFKKTNGAFTLRSELIYSGERLGLFGPSGCGKSTWAHILAGLIPADEGSIEINGKLVEYVKGGIRVPPEKRRVGLVFQKACLLPHLTVLDNLLYGYKRVPEGASRISPAQVIAQLALEPLLSRPVHNLSGGESQRVALGRTLLASPEIIVFDEPVSALDEEARYQVLRVMRESCRAWNIPYVYISHSVLEMRLMTDDVMLMENGQIQQRLDAGELARQLSGASPAGYCNLLSLRKGEQHEGMWKYQWGGHLLFLTQAPAEEEHVSVLSAKDVVLFREHPQAISARNLLPAKVRNLIFGPATCQVVLDCAGESLTAEVVHAAVNELNLEKDKPVYAAIKASAFRLLS